ncbi:MAG: XdhC family protein, partial [Oscillospiraceae bacterium]|nr:XdhC family protein [Oscillospiraceae bacterium]
AGDGGFCRENGTFTLPLEVGERVIVFGAGHVAQKLCPLLALVGFCPVVFDNRPELAREDLFPDAERIICGDFSRIAEYLTVTAEDYLVVMTNAHLNDMEVEDQLLRGAFAYLGVIGSKRKTLAVNEQLRARGITDAQLATVHTPIGTPIGAVTPAELAVSITGEMIAVRAARRGEKKHSCPMH